MIFAEGDIFMRKILAVILLSSSQMLFALTVDHSWRVVLHDRANASLRYAANVLSKQLERSMGKKIGIINENKWDGKSPAIFLGWSKSRKNLAFDGSRKYAEEEWHIRRAGSNVIQIAGSPVRGTLYGTFEFLERFAGYRAYTVDFEYIDRKKCLTVPDELDISGRPFFRYRDSTSGIYSFNPFWVHNRSFVAPSPASGWYTIFGSPRGFDTFYHYSLDFTKDEHFAMMPDGRRPRAVNGHGPGQICMSHPEVREIISKKMLGYIRSDRQKINKNRPRTGYPLFYALSVNDNNDFCCCSRCAELEKKYGAKSGAYVELLNHVAEKVTKVYPDVYIHANAYQDTLIPPRGIKAHDRVVISFAMLGKEFLTGIRETLFSLEHPANKKLYDIVSGWSAVSKNLSIWSYGRIFCENVPVPYTKVRAHADDIRLFARKVFLGAFNESEICEGTGVCLPGFSDLMHYLHMRMMIDPFQDTEALIADFMKKCYGPAAPFMEQLLAHIENALLKTDAPVCAAAYKKRKYITREFILKGDSLLTAAEKAAAGSPACLARVKQERIAFDSAMLNIDLGLLKDQGGTFDRNTVAKRWLENTDAAVKKYFFKRYYRKKFEQKALFAKNRMLYRAMLNPVKVPEFLKKADVVYDFLPPDFTTQRSGIELRADKDASGGQALYLTDPDHSKVFEMGLIDRSGRKKVLEKKTFPTPPADEKFHWCKFSGIKFVPHLRFWSHWSWKLNPVEFEKLYDYRDPERVYDVYISFKLQGPSYVKGSSKPDACAIDRVIITAHDPAVKVNYPGEKSGKNYFFR